MYLLIDSGNGITHTIIPAFEVGNFIYGYFNKTDAEGPIGRVPKAKVPF